MGGLISRDKVVLDFYTKNKKQCQVVQREQDKSWVWIFEGKETKLDHVLVEPFKHGDAFESKARFVLLYQTVFYYGPEMPQHHRDRQYRIIFGEPENVKYWFVAGDYPFEWFGVDPDNITKITLVANRGITSFQRVFYHITG